MHLTDTGLIFLQRTQALLDDLDDAELEVAGLQAEPRGRMRINAPMSFGLTHITAAVDSFLTLYPDIEIDLQLNDHLVDLVEQGVDIVGIVKHSGLRWMGAVCGQRGALVKRSRFPRWPDAATSARRERGAPGQTCCAPFTSISAPEI